MRDDLLPRDWPLTPVAALLASLDAVRNRRALFVLLASFALAGLVLAMARGAFAREALATAWLETAAAVLVALYGGSATGLLLLDQARGRPVRAAGEALADALRCGHRLLLLLLAAAVALAGVGALLAAALTLARLPGVGAAAFGLLLPAAVVVAGLALLATLAGAPLCAPAVWDGLGVRDTLRLVGAQLRRRLLGLALLVAAASALAAAVGALATFVVAAGARAVALLAPWAAGVDLPPALLFAGLFGQGVRSVGTSDAALAVLQSPHGAAALVGGGAVFVLALVLPALVYLRALCALYLALRDPPRP